MNSTGPIENWNVNPTEVGPPQYHVPLGPFQLPLL